MSSTKQKLRLTGAVAVLAILALGVSCKGFFVSPTLTSIAISPATPQVAINTQLIPGLQVFGTYTDGSRALVTSGVSWSTSDSTVVTINASSGVITGVSLGTATITAEAQALTATASATVFLSGVTSITVAPTVGNATVSTGVTQTFTYTATANGSQIPITTSNGGVLTITPATGVTCSAAATQMICSATTVGTYTLVMTYPGSSASATATLDVPN